MDDVEFRARIADPKFAEADREILKGRNNGRGDICQKLLVSKNTERIACICRFKFRKPDLFGSIRRQTEAPQGE